MIDHKTDLNDMALAPIAAQPETQDELMIEDLEERLTQGGVDCASSSTSCNCTCTCCWYSF